MKRRAASGQVLISLGSASDKAGALAQIVDALSSLGVEELQRVVEFARELKRRDRSKVVWFGIGPERVGVDQYDGRAECTPPYSCLVVEPANHSSSAPRTSNEIADDEQATRPTRAAQLTEHDEQAWNLRRELLAESLPVGDAAKRIGRTEQTAINRAKTREMLGIRDGVRWMFPKWQFDGMHESGLISGLSEVLRAVDAPPFSVALWLGAASPVLDGLRPIDVLKSGDIARVLTTARSIGSQ